MERDLSDLLNEWHYDPDDQVRIIRTKSGREVLQVRQPLGIEQYEMDGRPDGFKPVGRNSYLDIYLDRIELFKTDSSSDVGFTLEHEDYLKLQNEAILYYYRYLVLFQIGDFERTVKDTEHNLKICVIIEKYTDSDDEKNELLQYKPYILRINAISRAMLSLKQELQSSAAKIIESAIEVINNMPTVETPAFQYEKIRSLHSLKATLKQIQKRKPSPLRKLELELKKAVDVEDYERAATIRDKIEAIKIDGGKHIN